MYSCIYTYYLSTMCSNVTLSGDHQHIATLQCNAERGVYMSWETVKEVDTAL
jgi:hypothetical protein